jgi:uncharacterized protein (TIGR02266 family)
VEITLDVASEHLFWAGLSMDAAEGGVFVATYQPLALGTVVDIALRLQGETQPIECRGVVRWTRPHLDGSDGAAGVGIKFVELPDGVRDQVRRFGEQVREPIVFDLEDAPIRRRRHASSRPPPAGRTIAIEK